jgi:micrococcal nuclease
MKRWMLTILVVCVCLGVAHGWNGLCVGVTDGDTIEVMNDGAPVKIRLYGIDCPEKKQPFGTQAKQYTAAMVFQKHVDVEECGRDRYRRTIAKVTVNGKSLNELLVGAGLAWWYRKYAPYDSRLEQLEADARIFGYGLWSDPIPICPWDYRKKGKAR